MQKMKIEKGAGMLNAIAATRARPRIVGGQPAANDAYPWIVALYWASCSPLNCQFCGGALVRDQWVVTAAHCAVATSPNNVKVFLGSTNLADQGERLEVEDLLVHDDFDPNTLDNDIALVKLARGSNAPVIDIIPSNDPDGLTEAGKNLTIIGWGATSEGGQGSSKLLEVSVPIVSNEEANEAYAPFGSTITDNMVAAGLGQGGKDACQGDSGGPAIVKDCEGNWVLAGATSWGIGCARPNLPGIYTRLSRYWDWIHERIS